MFTELLPTIDSASSNVVRIEEENGNSNSNSNGPAENGQGTGSMAQELPDIAIATAADMDTSMQPSRKRRADDVEDSDSDDPGQVHPALKLFKGTWSVLVTAEEADG